MNDNEARLRMQDAMRLLEHLFPNRAIALFVIKDAPSSRTHYASNAKRSDVLTVMRELLASKEPLKGIPEDHSRS